VIVLAAGLLLAGLALLVTTGPARASDQSGTYVVRTYTYYRSADGAVDVDETDSSVSAQYLVNAHRWQPSAMPVQVRYNPAGQPDEYGMPTIIQQSLSSWTAVTPSTFSFAWAGTGSGDTGSCGNVIDLDGQNTVKFEPLPGVTLGRTCTVWDPGQGSNASLVEFDMQIDNDPTTWSAAPNTPLGKYDLASTILHELGHAAGLGHSTQDSAVMYPSLLSGTSKRALTADDIAGLVAAYPGGGTSTPTSTTTPTPISTPTSAPVSPSPTSLPIATPTPRIAPVQYRARALQLARD
jgi:hypothetical protein